MTMIDSELAMFWEESCESSGVRWADVFESDGEGLDDEEALPRQHRCRGEKVQPRLPNTSAEKRPLHADAVEFVPTLTMHCPLVAVCCVGAPASEHITPLNAPLSAEALLECFPRGAQPCDHANMFPRAPEEEWRCAQRQKELKTLSERLARHGHSAEMDTNIPDPSDGSVSRRQWKQAIDRWFSASLLRCNKEELVSVASTDEVQSRTTSTTWDDHESDSSF